jgi:Niemann-Pick C1 protein
MFILAAALQQQQQGSHPLAHRVGMALAAVGPSITLAGGRVLEPAAAGCHPGPGNPTLLRAPALGCMPPSWANRAVGVVHAASCEVVAFAVGALTSMPALRNFSGKPSQQRAANTTFAVPHHAVVLIVPHDCPTDWPLLAFCLVAVCAALALLLDFFLQVTAFVALLALDTARLEQGRYDCWPCVR